MSESIESGRRRLVIALVAGAAAGALLLWAFVGKRRVPPPTPADQAHVSGLAARNAEACLSCHARDTPLDRGRGHTGRQDCWGCHSR